MSLLVRPPPGGSGGGAVLAVLNVFDRNLQQPFLEAENGLVTRNRFDPGRTRIADDLRRIVVDPAIGHPRLWLNAPEPVCQRRDASLAILAHMLFTDPADRDDPARAVGQAATEVAFSIIDPNGMMFLGFCGCRP